MVAASPNWWKIDKRAYGSAKVTKTWWKHKRILDSDSRLHREHQPQEANDNVQFWVAHSVSRSCDEDVTCRQLDALPAHNVIN